MFNAGVGDDLPAGTCRLQGARRADSTLASAQWGATLLLYHSGGTFSAGTRQKNHHDLSCQRVTSLVSSLPKGNFFRLCGFLGGVGRKPYSGDHHNTSSAAQRRLGAVGFHIRGHSLCCTHIYFVCCTRNFLSCCTHHYRLRPWWLLGWPFRKGCAVRCCDGARSVLRGVHVTRTARLPEESLRL